jgi:D-3-phosphoglycerate dehydrogenase
LAGILGAASDERVNLVNAPHIARARGLEIEEIKDPEADPEYTNLIGVEVRSSGGTVYLAGTAFGTAVHLLRLNDFYLDMQPQTPFMLFTSHTDQPGMIGKIGTLAGAHDLNIGFMEVGRSGPRGSATMIVGFDDPVTDALAAEIAAIDGVDWVKIVRL